MTTYRSEPPGSTLPAGAWLAIVGGAILVAGSLLPWFTGHLLDGTVNRNGFQLGNNYGFSIDGLITLGLGAITALIGITRLSSTSMPRGMHRSPIVTGIIALVVLGSRIPGIQALVNRVNTAAGPFTSASLGYGLWVTGLGALLAIAGGLVLRSPAARTRPGNIALAGNPQSQATMDQRGVTASRDETLSDEIERLARLRDQGVLTHEQFEQAKERVLRRPHG